MVNHKAAPYEGRAITKRPLTDHKAAPHGSQSGPWRGRQFGGRLCEEHRESKACAASRRRHPGSFKDSSNDTSKELELYFLRSRSNRRQTDAKSTRPKAGGWAPKSGRPQEHD
jgi:hypothetical protein